MNVRKVEQEDISALEPIVVGKSRKVQTAYVIGLVFASEPGYFDRLDRNMAQVCHFSGRHQDMFVIILLETLRPLVSSLLTDFLCKR